MTSGDPALDDFDGVDWCRTRSIQREKEPDSTASMVLNSFLSMRFTTFEARGATASKVTVVANMRR